MEPLVTVGNIVTKRLLSFLFLGLLSCTYKQLYPGPSLPTEQVGRISLELEDSEGDITLDGYDPHWYEGESRFFLGNTKFPGLE